MFLLLNNPVWEPLLMIQIGDGYHNGNSTKNMPWLTTERLRAIFHATSTGRLLAMGLTDWTKTPVASVRFFHPRYLRT